MDPAMIYGPFAGMALLVYAVVHLYRENTALRNEARELLKEYRDREKAELELFKAEAAAERKRKADQGSST